MVNVPETPIRRDIRKRKGVNRKGIVNPGREIGGALNIGKSKRVRGGKERAFAAR